MRYRCLSSCSVVCQYFDTGRIGFEKENLITGYSEDLLCHIPHWLGDVGEVFMWMSLLFVRCVFFPCILIPLCCYVHCEASLLSLSSFFFCFPPFLVRFVCSLGLGSGFLIYYFLFTPCLFPGSALSSFIFTLFRSLGPFFHILYFAYSFAQPQCHHVHWGFPPSLSAQFSL